MTILYTYEVSYDWLIIIMLIIAVVLIAMMIALIISTKDWSYLLLSIAIIAIISLCVGIYFEKYTCVKALVDDTVSYREIYEHYEYIDQEGDIFTFKVKDNQ